MARSRMVELLAISTESLEQCYLRVPSYCVRLLVAQAFMPVTQLREEFEDAIH